MYVLAFQAAYCCMLTSVVHKSWKARMDPGLNPRNAVFFFRVHLLSSGLWALLTLLWSLVSARMLEQIIIDLKAHTKASAGSYVWIHVCAD